MKKMFGALLIGMITVGLIYVNYRAIKDSVPFLRRQWNKLTNSKPYTKVSSLIGNVTQSNIVQGTKSTAKNAGGRVVHMFKRSEKVA